MLPLLIQIVVILTVAGVIVWAARSLPFISPPFPQIITVVVVVIAALWVLNLFVPFTGPIGYNPSRRW